MATRVVNREAEKLFISSTNQSLCQNRNYVESVIKSANNYVNQLTIDSEFCDLLFKNFTDFPTYYENLESAQKRLDTIVLSDNMIDSINIIIPSGISLRSSSLHARTINISEDIVKRVIEQDFYKDAIKFYDKIFFLPPHKDPIDLDNKDLIISNVKSLKFVLSNNKSAVVFINIKPDVIQNVLSGAQIGKDGYISIVDKDGYIVSSPDSSMLGADVHNEEPIKKILSKDEGQFIYNDSKTHKEMFAIYTSSDFTGWKYIAVVPEDELTCAAPAITKGILRISSLCLILAVVIAFIISLYISKPINEVTKAMAMAESGNLNVRVKYNSNDELGRLSRGFNNMVEKINKLIEEEYKYKLLINKEKLELLQMQINPHLLYNTLAMVSYKARKENKIQIVEIAENLSNFYKGILSKGKNISTFREEVDMIKTYVSLAKSVYEIDINAIYEIDETIYDLFTLKLLMQPIVENSIIHGLKPKRGGILLVSAYIEDNNVNVIISDDGIGMDKAIVDQLNSITSYEDVYDQDAYEGYGISNVIKRIKLFFGDEYGINIDSNYDQGTTVIVKLPVIKQIDKQII